jgi:hypothetical protein
VARRWLGVFAVIAALGAAIAAVAVSGKDGKVPAAPTPAQLRPSLQTGDDAELMRRLQRKKLVKRAQ